MADTDKLRADFEKAEEQLQKEGQAYDDAKAKLRDRYQDKLAKLSERARDTQQAYANALAAEALAERDDLTDEQKQLLAGQLGLTLAG
jgi:ElaB/YqjD/DUF883 family membrane-anchored ribosome-binding protein